MAAGHASQTYTSTNYVCFHVLCCSIQIVPTCTILIPVRLLLVIWCVFINLLYKAEKPSVRLSVRPHFLARRYLSSVSID